MRDTTGLLMTSKMNKEVQSSRFKVQGSKPCSAVVLRTAEEWLRSRVGELLSETEEDSIVVYVPEKESYSYNFRASETAVYNTIVIVEAGGRLELCYEATEMSMSNRHIVLGEGSELRLNDLVVSEKSVDIITRVRANAHSKIKNVAILLGGNRSVVDYRTDLVGESAENEQWGLVMLSGNEQAKFGVAVNHNVAMCYSNELVKGVASASAHGEFNGMVYVAPDAQATEALQESRNLLLGDDCRFITSPQLEIYADDVKCSHGATVGQIEDNALFYMRQRGLDEPTARRLQLTGFVGDIVQKIDNEEFRERADRAVEQKLGEM